METYRVGGLQPGSVTHDFAKAENEGAYGLSIRVKGIDGHPYVIMNNQNRSPDSNGNIDKEFFTKDYDENDFRRGTENTLVDMQVRNSYSSAKASRELQKSSSSRNIKDDLMPANPYALKNGKTSPDGYSTLPSKSTSPVRTTSERLHSLPRASSTTVHRRSSALDKPDTPGPLSAREEVRSDRWAQGRNQTQPLSFSKNQPSQLQAQPQAKTQLPALSQPKAPGEASGPKSSTIGRSASTVSRTTSSERTVQKPDFLSLRRRDSCGPVLPSSRTHDSSTPDRSLPDEEALYAENINRHDNRRYIPFLAGTGRDIDSQPIASVDDLISKFNGDSSQQRRGRAGRRNRINPEDRKRSRSMDSLLPEDLNRDSECLDKFSKNLGRSTEHLLRPSQLGFQKGTQQFKERASTQSSSSPESPPEAVYNGASAIPGYRKELRRAATLQLKSWTNEEERPSRSVKMLTSTTPRPLTSSSHVGKPLDTAKGTQMTPDLLKGQQDVSQQTNEETARQILYNYLKDGSNDNDDATKRKVNLVFEKIQTLRSRAAVNAQGDSTSNTTAESKAQQEVRAQLESKVTELRKQLEEESKKQKGLLEACERAGADSKDLAKRLSSSQDECRRLREQLSKVEAELRSSLEELFQVKMEREQCQTQIRDLQDQLSEMHDELDSAKKSSVDDVEREAIVEAIMQLKMELEEALIAREAKEEILRKRERELTALKGALKEEVSSHDQEVDKMKEQYEQEIQKLRTSVEEAKQASSSAGREKAELEKALGTAEGRTSQLSKEGDRLHQRTLDLESQVAKLNRVIDEAKLRESRLEDRASRLEVSQESSKEAEDCLLESREERTSQANKTLATRLEDLQRNMTKVTQDYSELSSRLSEESSQKELLKKTKHQVEDERRLLDDTVEKLQKAMGEIAEASQASTQELQAQISEYREKNRQEVSELQKQLREKDLELEKARLAVKTLQEQLSRVDKDLKESKKDRDEAFLNGQSLKQKLYGLKVEVETKSYGKDDRSRQIKLMEERIAQLEQDLEDERLNGDGLMDRVSQGRVQVEQMRNELLQERAAKQDLECDKVALERRNKDLQSSLAHLQGSQKSSKEGLVSQLESRVQELEERLEIEERDRANLLQANRKLERKVKDMAMQLDDDRLSMQSQKDQNKDLQSSLAHLQGSQKSSKEGLVSQLESRVQELEERLEIEERDRANLLQANRKLERKVKDMAMQLDDDRLSMQSQKDQLVLKLKALKRQMDESEEEMERLEHSRKKLQRDLEEQVETNDQLHGQLKSLRSDLRRKTSATSILNHLDDDDDDEDISTNGDVFFSSASGRN
ncbi:hypothetical protein GJAV_G00251600 [Gymnothorax javanicus]|nr:hypothetical protein GJAV_G00251600 [Gymnothorax javanicus]